MKINVMPERPDTAFLLPLNAKECDLDLNVEKVEELYLFGFKEIEHTDGSNARLNPRNPQFCYYNANQKYWALYQKTKSPKWLRYLDKGKLYLPAKIETVGTETNVRRVIYTKQNRKYVVAFIDENAIPEKYNTLYHPDYSILQGDRDNLYLVNYEEFI